LKRPDKNKNKLIGNDVGYNGEHPSETRGSQQQTGRILMPVATNRKPNDDSNGEAKASIEVILGEAICAIINKNGEGKNMFKIIVRQWQTKQRVEEQQGEKEMQQHIDKFKAVSDEIQQ